jgi:Protein of unknown function (DUF3574)
MAPRFRAGFCREKRSAIVACSVLAAGVFASTPAASCSAPLQPMQRIELMFGRNIRGHAGVGDAAWAKFLAREITPRFPDGLTVVDAAGQWLDPTTGRLAHEPSRLVIIVTAGDAPTDDEKIAAIVAAYKQRFRQKSVGVVTSAACAAF